MTKSIAEIAAEIARYKAFLVDHAKLERVFGGLDAVRRHIENLELILEEKEAENGR